MKSELVQSEFKEKLESRYQPDSIEDVNMCWTKIKTAFTNAARSTIGISKGIKEDWFIDCEAEISDILEKIPVT